MAGELYKASCDPECAFMVQSHDKMEVAELIINHAEEKHEMVVSDEQAAEKIMVV